MDWFLYDNGLRHERIKKQKKYTFGWLAIFNFLLIL